MRNIGFLCCSLALLVLGATPLAASEMSLREAPCRLYDSRYAGSGNKVTTVAVATQDSPGATQGGESGCGVPTTASGVLINVTVYQPAAGGFTRIYAAGAAEPLSVALSYVSGQQDEATGLPVRIGTNGEITVKNRDSSGVAMASHIIIDLAGWIEDCWPEDTFELGYSASLSSISVPETGDIDLLKYIDSGSIWVGGGASQPGRYTITGGEVSNGRQRLFVQPTPQSATDTGIEVHLLSGACSPRETALDGV